MTDRLERLINLVIALRETRRPMAAEEIRRRVAGYGQDEHEAFRRMFERDKADLRALGVPIETAPLDPFDNDSGYRIDPARYDLPELRLEPRELAALALALRATGLYDAGGTGLLKLQVDAGDPDARRVPLEPGLGLDLGAPHLQALMEAQATRTPVRFAYRPAGRPEAQRTVDPHALVHRRGRWYLVARDHERDARRSFRLDRIAGAVTTVGEPGAFPPPPEVGVDDVVPPAEDGPATAEVLAAPEVAWTVARRARGGGRERPDGWSAFTVAVGEPEDFLAWALDLGPELVVVEPAELRAEVVDRLRAAAAAVAAGEGDR